MAAKKSLAGKIRGIVRPGFLALLCGAALFGWAANACYLKIGYLRLLSPAGFLEIAAVSRSIPWDLLPGFILLMLIIIFAGRVWCGWFCNVSFLSEKITRVTKGKVPPVCLPRAPKKIRLTFGVGDAAAIMGGLFLGMLIFGFPLFCIFCPVGVVSRNLISFFTQWQLRWDLVLLAVPVLVAMVIDTRKAPLCPAGLTRAVLAKPNHTLRPVTDQELCIRCGRCTEVCPAGLIPHQYADPSACIKCFSCVDNCPTGAITIGRQHCGKCSGE